MVKASKFTFQSCRYKPFPVRNQENISRINNDKEVFQRESNELECLYGKLRDVIPSCRKREISNTDVVFCAIDYIRELHSKLEKNLIIPVTIDRQPLSPVEDNTSRKKTT